MESLNHYSRLRCLRGFQNSGQILNVRNKGVRKTRRVHFRCYSVFKMSQLLSNESQKLSQVCHILSRVSQRERERTSGFDGSRFLPHTLPLCDPFNTLPHSALVQPRNTCFTLWLCAAFVVRNKFWSQRRSKLTPVCALSARLE